jgi:hypothetical protein
MLYTFLNLEYFSISSMLNANVKLTWETVLIAPGGHSMNYTFTLLYAEHKGHFDVVIVGHLCFDVCRTLNLYARCITAVSNCKCNVSKILHLMCRHSNCQYMDISNLRLTCYNRRSVCRRRRFPIQTVRRWLSAKSKGLLRSIWFEKILTIMLWACA